MAYPKSRSANASLQYGVHEGSVCMVGKDWSVNHPDIVLPDHAGPCGPDCNHEQVAPSR